MFKRVVIFFCFSLFIIGTIQSQRAAGVKVVRDDTVDPEDFGLDGTYDADKDELTVIWSDCGSVQAIRILLVDFADDPFLEEVPLPSNVVPLHTYRIPLQIEGDFTSDIERFETVVDLEPIPLNGYLIVHMMISGGVEESVHLLLK